MSAYYNEFELYAACWLRNLAIAGHIAPGRVDDQSIKEVRPEDIKETQAHFFAGIGVWSYALRLAGWPDDRPVWTGSCPCQPFSGAGKHRGFEDERHLWPEWFRLIRECRPPVVFGEQVARKDGLAWLDAVRADMEAAGYAFGAANLCAAGVGAPHIRQRLYFVGVAHAHGGGRDRFNSLLLGGKCGRVQKDRAEIAGSRSADGLGNPYSYNSGRFSSTSSCPENETQDGKNGDSTGPSGAAPTCGAWANPQWADLVDGTRRPFEPGFFPLVDGPPDRVGRLRAYGNAIVAPVASTFIRAVMDVLDDEAEDDSK